MPIYTALGPIDAGDLGPTSMHEHVLVDSRVWLEPSPAGRGTVFKFEWKKRNPKASTTEKQACEAVNQ